MGMFCLEQLIAFIKPKTEHCCHCGGKRLTTFYYASQNRNRPEDVAQLHSKGQPTI